MAKKGQDLAARFAKLSNSIADPAEKELFLIGVDVAAGANALAPGGKRLKGSYSAKLRHRGAEPCVLVYTKVPEAIFVEHAKKIDGHVYGKNLREPGRVLYKSLDDREKDIEQRIAAVIGSALGG